MISMSGDPGIHPTYTSSLKYIARGVCGEIRSVWKLVFENTSVCDETGMSRCFRSDSRYPCLGSNSSFTAPLFILLCKSTTGSEEIPAIGMADTISASANLIIRITWLQTGIYHGLFSPAQIRSLPAWMRCSANHGRILITATQLL